MSKMIRSLLMVGPDGTHKDNMLNRLSFMFLCSVKNNNGTDALLIRVVFRPEVNLFKIIPTLGPMWYP